MRPLGTAWTAVYAATLATVAVWTAVTSPAPQEPSQRPEPTWHVELCQTYPEVC